ncbi:cation:proton antiporter [Lentzea sp. JNUCC 0626]|uniref:cation:proton antiporter n=1 Tax=Lentzea sp. JNUCC 0626 TaxID=3367513 RepID=UPI003749FF4C
MAAKFLLGVALILVAAHGAGALAIRLGQPKVVGEIVAGLAIGPSLLGALSPAISEWLLPGGVRSMINGLAQLGLVLFMFGVGQEIATSRSVQDNRQAVLVSQASLFVPFAGGVLLALSFAGSFQGAARSELALVLFVGAAFSITAMPVLARILEDHDLTGSPVGRLSLLAAAIGDVGGWALLAAALTVAQGTEQGWWTAVSAVVVALLVVLAFGKTRARITRALSSRLTGTITPLVVVVTVMAFVTAALGVHQLVGALLVGLVWPTSRTPAVQGLIATSRSVLLPFFFLCFGFQVDLTSLRLNGETVLLLLALFVVAVVTKVAGAGLAARLSGLPRRESFVVGVLLNARGLTELVVLQVGYEAGLIDQRLFSMLTIVALTTTMMTAPLLRLAGVRLAPAHEVVGARPKS